MFLAQIFQLRPRASREICPQGEGRVRPASAVGAIHESPADVPKREGKRTGCRKGRPYGRDTDGKVRTGNPSVIRLAGDRRMTPSALHRGGKEERRALREAPLRWGTRASMVGGRPKPLPYGEDGAAARDGEAFFSIIPEGDTIIIHYSLFIFHYSFFNRTAGDS